VIENVEKSTAEESRASSARWSLGNRSADKPKVLLLLLSRKGHRESSFSSRFTFSYLVHLLLLRGIRRSQVYEPAIGTAWPSCRFQSSPGRRQVHARFTAFLDSDPTHTLDYGAIEETSFGFGLSYHILATINDCNAPL